MLASFNQVTKKFKQHEAVKDLSFDVKEGRCIALLGPNGAGKTTALQMLAGLMEPSSGKVIFGEGRPEIGFLPQHPAFFNWMTAAEFLQFAGELSGIPKRLLSQRIMETLEFVSLAEVKNKRIGGFSGGMKQQLGLAQALLAEPGLLILDEPVSALDPSGRKDVLSLVMELKKTMTIIFSTHILHDAEQVCDEILMLQKGRMKWFGTLDELRREFSGAGILIRMEEPLGSLLHSLPYVERVEQIDVNGARVLLKEGTAPSRLLWDLLEQKRSIIHFETADASLEDAYMKVMQ